MEIVFEAHLSRSMSYWVIDLNPPNQSPLYLGADVINKFYSSLAIQHSHKTIFG